jgi:hypothetical protein
VRNLPVVIALALSACVAAEPPVRADGDYSSPHPSQVAMERAFKQCRAKPEDASYDEGYGQVTLNPDPARKAITDCIAQFCQRHGVIPLTAPRIY